MFDTWIVFIFVSSSYSISQEICTRFCCALLCCGNAIIIMNSHEVFIHIHLGCFAGTGAIIRLPQCQWSKPDGYGKISQCITTTKHSKAKTVCIFLGIYCTSIGMYMEWYFFSWLIFIRWLCHAFRKTILICVLFYPLFYMCCCDNVFDSVQIRLQW